MHIHQAIKLLRLLEKAGRKLLTWRGLGDWKKLELFEREAKISGKHPNKKVKSINY